VLLFDISESMFSDPDHRVSEQDQHTHLLLKYRIELVSKRIAAMLTSVFLIIPIIVFTVFNGTGKAQLALVIVFVMAYPLLLSMCFNMKRQDVAGWVTYAAFLAAILTTHNSPSSH
jgi:uncharacterized protein DUF6594